MSSEQSCLIFRCRNVREESASLHDDICNHGYHFRFNVKFGLVPNSTLLWVPRSYQTARLLNTDAVFWKLLYRSCRVSGSDTEVLLTARWSSVTPCGRCLSVVDGDVSVRVDWAWRTDCMNCSFDGSNFGELYRAMTTEKTHLPILSQDY